MHNPSHPMKIASYQRWADIPWRRAAKYVHRLQCSIFDAERRGDTATVHKLQTKLANCFYAKALAVRQVAQHSPGRKTAGIDGVKSPGSVELMRMATHLEIHHRPSAVRRKWIPKPGKTELRPLGIPNLIDRAHQALLVIILAPQWEARFGRRQYGFRPGRGCHDAMEFLLRHLRKAGVEWVLELDIEAFFDRIDHDELLRRIDAPPPILDAVRRCLKAGAVDFVDHAGLWSFPDEGTPQGGPLSPPLANIVLSGLEAHLEKEFRREYRGRITKLGLPTLVIYADDAVVLHENREVVEWSRQAIELYLAPFGLRLSPTKTRVSNTWFKTRDDDPAGFDFLGLHFQYVRSAEKRKGGQRAPYLMVTPSKRSQLKFYRECAEIIDGVKLSRKQRGARRDRQAKGKPDPVTVMIHQLNSKIRGWGNYFRYCNAKETFSSIDNLLFWKTWRWATRRFDRKTVGWIRERLFSGLESDKQGKPLLRRDGTPRKRSWTFTSPFVSKDQRQICLSKLADIPILKHNLVRPEKSYFDGDWVYWQARSRKRYPGTPEGIPLGALRRQKGKCHRCGEPLCSDQRLEVAHHGRFRVIRHSACESKPPVPESACPLVDKAGVSRSKPGAVKAARRVSAEHDREVV